MKKAALWVCGILACSIFGGLIGYSLAGRGMTTVEAETKLPSFVIVATGVPGVVWRLNTQTGAVSNCFLAEKSLFGHAAPICTAWRGEPVDISKFLGPEKP